MLRDKLCILDSPGILQKADKEFLNMLNSTIYLQRAVEKYREKPFYNRSGSQPCTEADYCSRSNFAQSSFSFGTNVLCLNINFRRGDDAEKQRVIAMVNGQVNLSIKVLSGLKSDHEFAEYLKEL